MYTAEQKARLDAAAKRNELAKQKWQHYNAFWTEHFINLKCYSDTKYDISNAVTWFTPTDASCTAKAECTTSEKNNCKSKIKLVRDNIGNIRAAHAELLAAQLNYNTVQAEVTKEVQNDPDFILQQQQQAGFNQNVKIGLFIAGAVVVIIAFAWAYKKFVK